MSLKSENMYRFGVENQGAPFTDLVDALIFGVVIGEFIGSRRGLGYLIIYGSQVFQLDMVLMSIVILCIMAMILYQGINLAEKYCLKRF